jgi:hypothetical protein
VRYAFQFYGFIVVVISVVCILDITRILRIVLVEFLVEFLQIFCVVL